MTRDSHADPDDLDDRGVTLIEIVVAMMIMSVFMAMFTAGVVQMFHIANATESASTGQVQVNIAFLRLDKEVRYASDISTPGPSAAGADVYVEYLMPDTGTGSNDCTELWLDVTNQQLQRRTWPQGAGLAAGVGWVPLASSISAPATDPVFVRTAGVDAQPFQRLALNLVASSGSGSTATTKQFGITFTALNSSIGDPVGAICTEGRP